MIQKEIGKNREAGKFPSERGYEEWVSPGIKLADLIWEWQMTYGEDYNEAIKTMRSRLQSLKTS
jgi:hypothetical protein